MKNKIIRTFLTAILVHILPAITLYYTLGWTDELPDELTARPTLVLLGTFASAVLWFNNFRVLFYVIDVSDRKSIDCKIILGSLGKMNTMVRKSFAIVLAICILLPSFIATAIAADVTDGFSQKASDSGYFCVDDLEKNSDILIKTDTDAVTFVEDAVINGTQSLASAGMAAVTENNPELSGIDSNTMTVAEYTAWQQSNALQNFKKGLSTEAMDFAAKKGITLSDLSFLNRYFYGNYMEETDNNLRNALLQFYSTDVEYLQNQANPFADIAESDWFYDDVLHIYDETEADVSSKVENDLAQTTTADTEIIADRDILQEARNVLADTSYSIQSVNISDAEEITGKCLNLTLTLSNADDSSVSRISSVYDNLESYSLSTGAITQCNITLLNDEQECIAYMIGDFQYGNCIAWISPDYENAFVAQEGPQPDN